MPSEGVGVSPLLFWLCCPKDGIYSQRHNLLFPGTANCQPGPRRHMLHSSNHRLVIPPPSTDVTSCQCWGLPLKHQVSSEPIVCLVQDTLKWKNGKVVEKNPKRIKIKREYKWSSDATSELACLKICFTTKKPLYQLSFPKFVFQI